MESKKKPKSSEEPRGRTGIKTQTQIMDLRTQGGGRLSWDKVRKWHGHIYTTKCKIDSQWEAAAQHREISSVLCVHLDGWDREGGRETKERGDIGVYVQVQLIHFVRKQKLTHNCKAIILQDRKSVVQGKSVDLGGRRIIKKKNGHEELRVKTGIKMQTCQRMDLRIRGGGRVSWDKVRECHGHIYTTKCKIDSLQEAAASHREISSVLFDHLEGWDREDGKEMQEGGDMGIYVCVQLIHFVIKQKLTHHCKAIILQ